MGGGRLIYIAQPHPCAPPRPTPCVPKYSSVSLFMMLHEYLDEFVLSQSFMVFLDFYLQGTISFSLNLNEKRLHKKPLPPSLVYDSGNPFIHYWQAISGRNTKGIATKGSNYKRYRQQKVGLG